MRTLLRDPALSSLLLLLCLSCSWALAWSAPHQVVFEAFPNTTSSPPSSSTGWLSEMPIAEDGDAYVRFRSHLATAALSVAPADRSHADPQRVLEDRFLRVATASSARDALKRYTAEPHPAGTPASFDFAVRLLREWGTMLGADLPAEDDVSKFVLQAGTKESQEAMTGGCSSAVTGPSKAKPRVWIDTYETLVTDPISSHLSVARQGERQPYWTADLNEAVLTKDPTSSKGAPPYHAFSASGNVTGRLVYANQGTRADMRRLVELGVDVRGAIVLVRYGRNFRGRKIVEAQRAGAAGVLLYSDPSEDGEVTEANGYKSYPSGPARHKTSIQRGSVRSGSPGDPTTPGWPSYPGKDTKRLPIEEAHLPRIPSLPISFENAAELFKILHGQGPNATEAGKGWNGNVPGTSEYFLGPSADSITLENIVELNLKPMYNVYACIPGHVSNETVFLGNHRDAWSYGAADPGSGTAVMHEIVKSLGALVNGDEAFRPLRQIMIASWDGEEFGLAGSTEFGEDFSEWLQANVAVYHNLDIAVQGGWLSLGAVPSLIDVFQRSAERLPDLRNKGHGTTESDADNDPLEHDRSLEIRRTSPLGSGSDYSVFLLHNAIASSMAAYRRRRTDPVYMYHSNFDSMYWMENFGDPHFRRHESMAKLVGLVALRSATEFALPIRTDHYAQELGKYLAQVNRALGEARNSSAMLSRTGSTNSGGISAGLAQVRDAVERVKRVTAALERARTEAVQVLASSNQNPSRAGRASAICEKIAVTLQRLRAMNALVARFENGFLARSPSSTAKPREGRLASFPDPGPGLPERPWFRHLIIAPGRESGYGATAFPGLMEAITLDADALADEADAHVDPAKLDKEREALAIEEAHRIVEVLEALAHTLEDGLRGVGVQVNAEVDHDPARGGYKARV